MSSASAASSRRFVQLTVPCMWFNGPIALSGSIASGGAILAAQVWCWIYRQQQQRVQCSVFATSALLA